MATISVQVCDKCGGQKKVETYTLGRGVQRGKVDLCEDHSGPIIELLALVSTRTVGGSKRSRGGSPGGRGGSLKVTTPEEVEEMKQKK